MNKARTVTMFVPYIVVGIIHIVALARDATAVTTLLLSAERART